jgi:hypothetical protein
MRQRRRRGSSRSGSSRTAPAEHRAGAHSLFRRPIAPDGSLRSPVAPVHLMRYRSAQMRRFLGRRFLQVVPPGLTSGVRHGAYLVLAMGSVIVNGVRVEAREGVALREEPSIEVEALSDGELVLIVEANLA